MLQELESTFNSSWVNRLGPLLFEGWLGLELEQWSVQEKQKVHLFRSKELRVPFGFESVFGFGRKKSQS